MTKRLLDFLVPALGFSLLSSIAFGQSFTTMTYNIRHGLTTKNQSNLSRVSDLIRSNKADIVALQEIDSATVRSLGRNQTKQLAKATGMKSVYAKAVSEKRGSYGLAILSRYPIIASQIVQLPSPEEGASRVLLCAYVELPNEKTVRFCTAKLDPHSAQNRIAQAAIVTALLKESIQPVVWAGDFHSNADDPIIRQMARYWRYAGVNVEQITFPELASRFDYILTRPNDELSQLTYRVVKENRTSDHYPVIASFRLK
ncbi:MAG: endonuclease/exonuclease/phosphatase family protein [Rudanella sp.]|nr:endonuclease/exonuclease/phosphatase family protein [Rudanella sp.]